MTTFYRFDQITENIAIRIDPSDTDLDRYVGLEHLDPETLKIKRWGAPSDVIGEKLHFWPGDIIYGKRRAYQRKLAVADFEGICSAHAFVFRAKEDVVLPEFLPFFMQSELFHQRALQISVGSLSPTINWKTLAQQEFPLPPLDEQCRIAEILWAANETLENYKIALQTISKAKETLITDYLDNIPSNGKVFLYPISELEGEKGPILKTGPFGSSLKSEYFSKTGVPVLNISSVGEIGIDEEGLFFLPQNYAKKFKTYEVIENDIVFSRVAEVGRCLLIPKECEGWIISSNVIRIRLNSLKVMPLYFLYLLKFSKDIQMQIKRVTTGGGRVLVNTKTLNELNFQIPSMDYQRQVCEKIRDFDGQILAMKMHIEKTTNMFIALREKFLIGDHI